MLFLYQKLILLVTATDWIPGYRGTGNATIIKDNNFLRRGPACNISINDERHQAEL